MDKLIPLKAWAEGIFGKEFIPHSNTLRRWAEDGPLKNHAVRIGRNYYIRSNVTIEVLSNPLHGEIERLKAML